MKCGFQLCAAVTDEVDGMPPSVIDVTYALQYLVSDSRLELFSGVSKAGLMGFCDVAPNQKKTLRIQYLYRNRAYRAQGAISIRRVRVCDVT